MFSVYSRSGIQSRFMYPLAPATIVATGSIFGAINLYLDFGVRVQSATNLSNKTI